MDDDPIAPRLQRIEIMKNDVLKVGKDILSAGGGQIRTSDLSVILGATKRTICHCSGFSTMIVDRNFICASSILRMQLDTALRIYACSLVNDLEDFSRCILRGERVDKYKDKDGKNLRDAYLVNQLSQTYPWVKNVYAVTSGFIHLSNKHFNQTIAKTDDKTHIVHFEISDKDVKRPPEVYIEVLEAFISSTDIILSFLRDWEDQKNQSLFPSA